MVAKASLNDLLVAALHAAISRWNRERGRVGGEIRVRIPVTQRASAARWGSVGNHTSQAIVRSTPTDRISARDLLGSVVRQTGHIKRDGPAGGPAAVVGRRGPIASLIPARSRVRLIGLAVELARHWLMPTAALSNLGRIAQEWTFGRAGPQVTSVHFAVFAGPPQGLAVGVAGYRDRTTLTFGCSRAVFNGHDARRLASMFVEELRRVRAAAAPSARATVASASLPA